MSRCFPYPPPGDEKRVALIESIKLQKGKEKAKKERKKEKKRGKKEKSRGDNGKREEKQQDHRKRPYGEFVQADNKLNGCLKTTREDESAAQLERSSLTEEQGPAVAQNICDSSDSTQNSSKRRKHESPEISHTHGNGGLGLRIRLPLVRHKDLEPPPPPPPPRSSVERPCFSGRRIETVPAQRETRATGHDPGLLLPPSSSEQPCFSGRIGATPSEEALAKEVVHGKPPSADAGGGGRHHHHTCGCSCDSHARRQYKKLIRDWNPPPLQAENPEPDDQDWLFARKASSPQRLRRGEEPGGQVAGEDLDLGNALCAWPPRACYLPEVGVYALPYVVPL